MYSSIIVPVDLDEPSSWAKAAPVGLALAQSFNTEITLCTVVPYSTAVRDAQWSAIGYRQILDNASARLSSLARKLCADTELPTRVGSGQIVRGILHLAEEVDADLIILASHRPEMKDWLIGANATRVVRHAPCSVMVVRD